MDNFREDFSSSGLTNSEPETIDPSFLENLGPKPVDALGSEGTVSIPLLDPSDSIYHFSFPTQPPRALLHKQNNAWPYLKNLSKSFHLLPIR